MKIAVIPARGGSKRIPRKNIRSFNGAPIISWSILAAKESAVFDKIVVSTDDDEIASVALDIGAEVPFFRPKELSGDYTPTVPVIAHAISECNSLGWDVDYACCIYPCAPFVWPQDIRAGIELMNKRNSDFVYTVTEYPHPIQRAMTMAESGKMDFITPTAELIRTQDLEAAYHDAAQFYWGRASAWLSHKKMHTDGIGMPIPSWRVVDIDTSDDWLRAEIIFRMIGEIKTISAVTL